MSQGARYFFVGVALLSAICVAEGSQGKAGQEFKEIQRAVDECEISFLVGIKRYRRAIRRYPESEFSARASYAIGELFEKIGKVEEASIAYLGVIENYPDSEYFSPAIQGLYRIGRYLFNLEETGVLRNTYEQARTVLRKILEVFPSVANAGEIQYKMAYCSLELGQYDEAASEFQKVIKDYPEEPFLEKAIYYLAVSFLKQSLAAERDQTMTDRAMSQFTDFLSKYPESQFVEDAQEKISILRNRRAKSLYSICLFYMKRKEKRAFLFYCRDLVRRFPDTEWAKRARKLLER